jgi:hypothetical protein
VLTATWEGTNTILVRVIQCDMYNVQAFLLLRINSKADILTGSTSACTPVLRCTDSMKEATLANELPSLILWG